MKTIPRMIIAAAVLAFLPASAEAADVIRDIEFPVTGTVRFTDDYGDPRSGGRTHEGIDLIGEKMMPLVAAVDGYVSLITIPEASWGYGLVIRDSEGWEYWYLHINNDTPGTDDGDGGPENAFAPGLRRGSRVERGQVVAYMGDSGNAEYAGPHLHFEIQPPGQGGGTVNPYPSLIAATRGNTYDPIAETARASTIDADKGLEEVSYRFCLTGTLLTTPLTDAVYYCGANGKRYVFPNVATYRTWFTDFTAVQTISSEELAAIQIGGAATYRPGVRLVKLTTDPKVYAVSRDGVLRWVSSPEIATSLYGKDWAKFVDDLPDAYFANYSFGDPITST